VQWPLLARRRLTAVALVLLAAALIAEGVSAQDDGETFAFEVDAINAGLVPAEPPLQRDSPRAALETFLDAIRSGDFLRAAHVLNLGAFPPQDQEEVAPQLALMLAFVLRRYDLVDWSEIPDQPDARVIPGLEQPISPYSRRSVPLGEVVLEGRPVPISIQRFQVEDEEPVWLFSPFVVKRVPALYAASRPGLFSDWVPLERRLETLGQVSRLELLAAGVFLVVAVAVGFLAYGLARLFGRVAPARWQIATRRAALPLAIAAGAGSFAQGSDYLFPLTGPVGSTLGVLAEVIALVAAAVLILKILSAATLALTERYVVPLAAEDPEHRRTKTAVYVMRRISLVVVTIVTVAYILVRAGLFESFGVSILASAGALGIVFAIAARPLFGNIVAGMQIALTDPVRIGDVVVYGGTFATVEDISFAHLVLLTEHETRLIVPHEDFLARSFENWSKGGEAVWRVVKVPVDFSVDVPKVREHMVALARGDGRFAAPPRVELSEADADAALLWIWVCGTSAETTWVLHNEMMEKAIALIATLDGGAYLPRRRHVVAGDHARGGVWEEPLPFAPRAAASQPGPHGS